MKGDHVPLSDKGYQLLVRWGSIDDMVVFVRRVVEDLSEPPLIFLKEKKSFFEVFDFPC